LVYSKAMKKMYMKPRKVNLSTGMSKDDFYGKSEREDFLAARGLYKSLIPHKT